MFMPGLRSFAALALLAATTSALAADSAFSGTWKEDLTKNKSSLVVSYTAKGSGFHFSNGSTIAYDFACDGKVYQSYSNVSIRCTMNGDGSIDWVNMTAGKVTSEQHRVFSADGKTMTMNETDHLSDGTDDKFVLVRARKSGTTGLAGEWVNAKVTDTEPDVMMIAGKGDLYRMQHAHSDSVLEVKFDGTPASPTGKLVPPGATVTIKQVSANKLEETNMLNGKVMSKQLLTLSADGKTLTEEQWLPGKESQKTTSVYLRQ